jgi:hypothetical protein
MTSLQTTRTTAGATAALAMIVLMGSVAAAPAKDATIVVSKPTHKGRGFAGVRIDYPDGKQYSIIVEIPEGASTEQKRDLIVAELKRGGVDAAAGGRADEVTIKDLPKDTKVHFNPLNSGEVKDTILSMLPPGGVIEFKDVFQPYDWNRQPAVFTGGIVTDVGELSAQVSAQELNFQTDGPIICQALFQRLAPRAPQYGAQLNYAGDRLEVYFDPAYTVTQGGVVFGTTSPSEGSSGQLVLGGEERCPGDTNGDGVVDQVDLAKVLAAYGTRRGDEGFDPDADVNGDGTVDQSDLAEVLAHYGERC